MNVLACSASRSVKVCRLFGRALQGGIVEVCIDCSCLQPSVTEQPPDGWQADAVHDALRGVGMPAVVNAHIIESCELAKHEPTMAEIGHGPVALRGSVPGCGSG